MVGNGDDDDGDDEGVGVLLVFVFSLKRAFIFFLILFLFLVINVLFVVFHTRVHLERAHCRPLILQLLVRPPKKMSN